MLLYDLRCRFVDRRWVGEGTADTVLVSARFLRRELFPGIGLNAGALPADGAVVGVARTFRSTPDGDGAGEAWVVCITSFVRAEALPEHPAVLGLRWGATVAGRDGSSFQAVAMAESGEILWVNARSTTDIGMASLVAGLEVRLLDGSA